MKELPQEFLPSERLFRGIRFRMCARKLGVCQRPSGISCLLVHVRILLLRPQSNAMRTRECALARTRSVKPMISNDKENLQSADLRCHGGNMARGFWKSAANAGQQRAQPTTAHRLQLYGRAQTRTASRVRSRLDDQRLSGANAGDAARLRARMEARQHRRAAPKTWRGSRCAQAC